MGGFGSGGGRWAPRVQHFLDLDLATLKRLGLAEPGRSGALSWSRNDEETGSIRISVRQSHLHLSYRTRSQNEDWLEISEDIAFAFSPAGFGGQRRWFLCPACNRRARILYGGRYFRCRRCVHATYDSQYEPITDACHSRIKRIRLRLGDMSGWTWDAVPSKPAGMHWKTYWRFCEAIYDQQQILNRAIAERLGVYF